MTSRTFEAHVRQLPGQSIIDLSGEINASAENDPVAAYSEAESQNPATVVLNFTNVQYINSTGIALIVELLGRSRKAHRHMVVFGLSDHYVEIFHITRLADFMTIFPDEVSAIAGQAI